MTTSARAFASLCALVSMYTTGRCWAETPAAPAVSNSGTAAASTWACAACHQTSTWTRIAERAPFDHRLTGTPLAGAHSRAPCSGCHRPAERAQPKVPRACADCHRDMHRGELGADCAQCHSATSWWSPRSLPSHETARFALTGAHTATDCRACHQRATAGVYRGTPQLCADCHGGLATTVRKPDHRAAGFGPGCQPCHSTFSWAPARVNHALWWTLEGKHATLGCDSCHTVGVFRGKGGACLGCHADKLAGAHPDHKSLGFSSSCENCHTSLGWRVLKRTWHDNYYRISGGKHANIACAGCHGGGFAATQLVCTSCHEHDQAEMAHEHDDVGGYVWQSKACYDCHRKKGKGD
ncbi:MAG: hypothetical protein FJ100_20695 [Deltaproteobacteria bacterium]|nr:hypothetical protein [Deltaproteobacteria bacterium]